MMDWLWNTIVGFLLGWVPLWAWIIVAGLLIGWAWRTFGWQGVVGAAIAVLTLGAYRQGWRDRGQGKDPIVPPPSAPKPRIPASEPRRQSNKPRRNIRSVWDIIRGRND